MTYPRKISDECLKDFLDEDFTQSEIARACSISRQAVSIRVHYKPKKPEIKLRNFTVLFLRRLGFSKIEIENYTNYSNGAVWRILREHRFLRKTKIYWKEDKE